MTDQPTNTVPAPVCPWCSAALPDESATRCPSCGAALVSDADDSLPGLTAIDAGAIVRSRQTAIRPKSRLLSWLSGDDPDDVFTKAEGNALEPPELAVRREMLRMELEAEVASLQADNEAALAEAVAEGRTVELPPDLADAAGALVPDALSGAIATTEGETTTEGEATIDAPGAGAQATTDEPTAAEPPAADEPAGAEPPTTDEAPTKKRR